MTCGTSSNEIGVGLTLDIFQAKSRMIPAHRERRADGPRVFAGRLDIQVVETSRMGELALLHDAAGPINFELKQERPADVLSAYLLVRLRVRHCASISIANSEMHGVQLPRKNLGLRRNTEGSDASLTISRPETDWWNQL
jgi:hypothetical protein